MRSHKLNSFVLLASLPLLSGGFPKFFSGFIAWLKIVLHKVCEIFPYYLFAVIFVKSSENFRRQDHNHNPFPFLVYEFSLSHACPLECEDDVPEPVCAEVVSVRPQVEPSYSRYQLFVCKVQPFQAFSFGISGNA